MMVENMLHNSEQNESRLVAAMKPNYVFNSISEKMNINNEDLLNLIMRAETTLQQFQELYESNLEEERRQNSLSNILHEAIKAKRGDIVQYLILNGHSVESKDRFDRTALHFAVESGQRELVVLLLGNGAKVTAKDIYGNTPLLVALKKHFFDLVPDLLLFGSDINCRGGNGMTILHSCLYENDEPLFDFLMEQQQQQLKDSHQMSSSLTTLKLGVKDNSGMTPLLRSCEQTKASLFFKFFNLKGLDRFSVDEKKRNVFHLLAKFSRQDILTDFLRLSKDYLGTLPSLLILKDYNGQIALHTISYTKKVIPIRLMLELYSKYNIPVRIKDNKNQTPYDILIKESADLKDIAFALYKDFKK